ncbi:MULTISPECIES: cupin domain-containing protein [Streptacidiphilus]|uniref:Cupin domain-containing protein n=1 Tax=Streptacidiphilus cavernicola TaxID=3342716 RepID=A0ABV6UJ68_9ACTN|nr:cupin domain-containing protein [Streptacidiphilus jeojiense]
MTTQPATSGSTAAAAAGPASCDGFHPDLPDRPVAGADPAARFRVHHVRADDLDGDTAQTGGMRRFAAISGARVGSERMWMGQTHVAPATASADHHHGASETAIYVVSGHPEFVFLADGDGDGDGGGGGGSEQEVRLRTGPGDYIFVPPFVPHREENPDPDDEAVVVIARSTQEAVVVNLPGLHVLRPEQPHAH